MQSSSNSIFPAPKRIPATIQMLEIMCLFKRRNNFEQEVQVRVAGRPTGESGVSRQGQHVTAFALVKKGFTRHLIADEDHASFSAMKDTVIAYVERLSVLERLYVASQSEPSHDTSSGGGGGGAAADIIPMQIPSGSEDAHLGKASYGGHLNECVSEVLQLYSETRVYKSYLRQASEDIKEGSEYYNAMKDLDITVIDKVLSFPQKRKEEIIKELIQLFGSRFVCGDKNAAIFQFQKSLEEYPYVLTVENCFDFVDRHNLSRSKSIGQGIESQRKANLRLIEDVCETLAELSVAYYNRMRGVSFNRTHTKPYPADRMTEAAALKYLDERYCADITCDVDWLNPFNSKLEEKIRKKTQSIANLKKELASLETDDKKIKNIEDKIAEKEKENETYRRKLDSPPDLIKALVGLFDYPAVQGKKEGEISTEAGVRDNSIEKLTFLMARHLHIAFAVYPETIKQYTPEYWSNPSFRDQIVLPFVNLVLSEGWNCLVTKAAYGDIATNVLNQMQVFFPPNKALQSTSQEFDSSSLSSDSLGGGSGSSSDQEEVSAPPASGGGASAARR